MDNPNWNTASIFYDILKNAPGYIFWKDINSVYRGCNLNGAKLYGVSSIDEIVGKTDLDFNQEQAEEFIKQDQYVIKTGKSHISESDIINAGDNKKLVLRTEKNALYNENGKLIGIVGIATDITGQMEKQQTDIENKIYKEKIKIQEIFKDCMNSIQYLIQEAKINTIGNKTGTHIELSDKDKKIVVTKREKEILYFLSMGKTPKEIASIVSVIEDKDVSSGTIGAFINKQLYPKFEVFNVSQLVEKATLLKLIPFLNEELL